MNQKLGALAVVLCFGVGCTDGLPKAQLLDRLRILALATTTPEVAPGATVVITPFVSDVRGEGRTLTFTAVACSDPGVSYGAFPSCDHDAAAQVFGEQAISLTAPQYTGASPTFISVTVPADLFTTRLVNPVEQFNGANYLVIVSVTASDGEVEKAFRRIKVSGATKVAKNQNPVLTGFQKEDGTAVTVLPTEPTDLLATVGPGSAESYSELNTDGSLDDLTETILVSWFASDGEIDNRRLSSGSSILYTPAATSTYSPFLIAVARDERGGVTVLPLNP